jgi:hypothetical protein
MQERGDVNELAVVTKATRRDTVEYSGQAESIPALLLSLDGMNELVFQELSNTAEH